MESSQPPLLRQSLGHIAKMERPPGATSFIKKGAAFFLENLSEHRGGETPCCIGPVSADSRW